MARTFVQQSQISGSLSYDDGLAAGQSLAGQLTLVDDLNALRSQLNKIIGGDRWYDALSGSQNLADVWAAVHVDGANAAFQGDVSVAGDLTGSAGFQLAGDADLNGALDVSGASDLHGAVHAYSTLVVDGDITGSAGLDIAGAAHLESTLVVDGAATFGSDAHVMGNADVDGTLIVGGVADFSADVYAAADLAVSGTLTVAQKADFADIVDVAGTLSASAIKIDGDAVGHLYFVGSDNEIQDSGDLYFDGSMLQITGSVDISNGLNVAAGGMTIAGDRLEVTGSFGLLGDAAIDGALSVSGKADFAGIVDVAGTLSASAVKIDSDVAKRLYIVDEDGSIKDEEKLWFDQSKLYVTGSVEISSDLEVKGGDITMSNSMSISSATAGKLLLTSDLVEASGDLQVTGNTIKSSTADAIELSGADVEVKGDLQVSGNDILDSGAATVLTFKTLDTVDHSVEVANNMEVKGDMFRAVSGSFSGDLTVAGDLTIQGSMTYIDTENLKVKDTLIHLNVGGGSNLSPRGIVLHGDQAYDDLAFGAKPASGDFVLAMNVSDADVDAGNSDVFAGAKLAAAWLGEVKLGGAEGSLSGSLAATAAGAELSSTADLSVTAADDLLLAGNGATALTFVSGSAEYDSFMAQFPGYSIVGAIVAAGGNFKQDSFLPGAVAANTAISFTSVGELRTAALADDASKKIAMDVYLNGVRLAYTEDYIVHSATQIKLTMATMEDDRLFIAIHNAK